MTKAPQQTPEFESILDMPFDQIERPKPLPTGSYATIVKSYRIDRSPQQQTDFIELTHQIIEALEDVDPTELEKYLAAPDGSTKSLRETTIRNTYYMTGKAVYRFKEFVKNCGVPVNGSNSRRAAAECVNQEVGLSVRHKPWTNNEGVSIEIARSFPIE